MDFEKIFAVLDMFVGFIAGIDAEAGKWIKIIVDFAKALLELDEEPPVIIE